MPRAAAVDCSRAQCCPSPGSWSLGPASSWGTVDSVAPAVDAGFRFGLPIAEPSAQAAFKATLDKHTTLALFQAQRLYFSLEDAPALDDRGGVSIRIVPEPSGAVAWAVGLIGLTALLRSASAILGAR